MKNIVLIGIMGCGKTTISQLLSERLHRPLIDLDDYLVKKYNQTIPSMFEISEDYFRDRESECCQDVSLLEGYIVSTGGGVIKREQNMEYLKKNGYVIYLDRPIVNILDDVDTASRPLLKDGPDQLYDLYHQRHQLYLKYCDYHLINDSTLEKVVNEIIDVIENS